MKSIKKRIVLSFVTFMSLTSNVSASPTGVITDIFEVQIDALGSTSQQTVAQLAQNIEQQLENVYAIVDNDIGNIDLNDKDILTKVVDKIAENNVIASRTGLAGSLSSIVNTIDAKKEIDDLIGIANIPNELKDVLDNGIDAAKELTELMKNDTRGTVLRNILEYGSGRRDGKVTAMLMEIDQTNYQNIFKIAKALNDTHQTGTSISEKIIGTLINVSKQNIANEIQENLSNPAWAKVVIQDMVIKKWKQQGIINDNNINDFQRQNIYTKAEEGLFIKTPIVEKVFTAANKYSLLTEDQILDIEYPVWDNLDQDNGREKPNPKKIDNEKEKEALADLEDKKRDTDNKINDKQALIDSQKSNLKDLETRLKNTSKEITTTEIDSNKMRNIEKAKTLLDKYSGKPFSSWTKADKFRMGLYAKNIGFAQNSTEMAKKGQIFRMFMKSYGVDYFVNKYAVQTITNKNNEYYNLLSEIDSLTTDIRRINQELTTLKLENNDLAFSIKNLTDDINDDTKGQIATNNTPSSEDTNKYWQGTYTGNYYSENHLGEVEINGYTDSYARTKENKPDNNVKLYLNENGNSSSFPDGKWANAPVRKEITLNQTSSAYFGNYDYTAWGTWSDSTASNTANQKVYTSHWVVGQRITDRPKTGTATYQGELAGTAYQHGVGNTAMNVNGTITLNANFSTKKLDGSMTVKNASNNSTWATASFNNIDIQNSNSKESMVFNGQLTDPGISSGQIRGEFFGKKATETGGIWAIDKNGVDKATGVFRAKKQ